MDSVLSLAAPVFNQLVTNYAQSAPAEDGGSSVDPNGPHTQVLTQLYNTFKPLLTQGTSDQQGNTTVAPLPTPYSTSGIPADIQNEPMSQFQAEDVARFQNYSGDAALASTYRESSADGVQVRDHRTVNYDAGNSDVIVRDHRHPVTSYPPAAPPSGSSGTAFTSGADYDKLNQANSNLEAAKQAALDDPTDPAKQLAFQEAAQALQLLMSMLTQLSSMKASIADSAIKGSKVQAA